MSPRTKEKRSRVDWLMEEMQSEKPSRVAKRAIWLGESINIEAFSLTFWMMTIFIIGMPLASMFSSLQVPIFALLLIVAMFIYLPCNMTISTYSHDCKRSRQLICLAKYSGIPYKNNSLFSDYSNTPYHGPSLEEFPRAWVFNNGRHLAFNKPNVEPENLDVEAVLRNPLLEGYESLVTILPYKELADNGLRLVSISFRNIRPASITYAKLFNLDSVESVPHHAFPITEQASEQRKKSIETIKKSNVAKLGEMKTRLQEDVQVALANCAAECNHPTDLEQTLGKILGQNWKVESYNVRAKSNNWEIAQA